MLNPTNCSPHRPTGTLSGGGSDPSNPAAFSSYAFTAPFAVAGCSTLDYGPALTTTLSGATKRHGYPKLTATLLPRPGDANISSLALTLPHSFLVAQEHLNSLCTRPQLAAGNCPPQSVYGEAEASSPLLDGKLSGPVYLVPGGHPLPDLVVDLHGQVDLQLHGIISSTRGRITTRFESVPDVPVGEFVLKMAGGRKGLLVNSTNLCKKSKQRAVLNLSGQNEKQLTIKKYKLKIAKCKKHMPKRHHHSRHSRH
jgi:hypothetical protein